MVYKYMACMMFKRLKTATKLSHAPFRLGQGRMEASGKHYKITKIRGEGEEGKEGRKGRKEGKKERQKTILALDLGSRGNHLSIEK